MRTWFNIKAVYILLEPLLRTQSYIIGKKKCPFSLTFLTTLSSHYITLQAGPLCKSHTGLHYVLTLLAQTHNWKLKISMALFMNSQIQRTRNKRPKMRQRLNWLLDQPFTGKKNFHGGGKKKQKQTKKVPPEEPEAATGFLWPSSAHPAPSPPTPHTHFIPTPFTLIYTTYVDKGPFVFRHRLSHRTSNVLSVILSYYGKMRNHILNKKTWNREERGPRIKAVWTSIHRSRSHGVERTPMPVLRPVV